MGVPSDAVIIVGGGLSGLAAAVQLGRLDARVVLFDDADEIGEHLNFGPHRLYERGAAVAGLRQLGVPIDGAPRGPNGGFAIWRGTKHTLPVGYCSLLTTDLFGLAAKLEAARFLAAIPAVRVSALHDVALGEWLETQVRDPRVLEFVLALIRFTTYANDPERLSAAAAVEQLALSLAGRGQRGARSVAPAETARLRRPVAPDPYRDGGRGCSALLSDQIYGEVTRALTGPFRRLPLLTIFGERNDPLGFQPQWKRLSPNDDDRPAHLARSDRLHAATGHRARFTDGDHCGARRIRRLSTRVRDDPARVSDRGTSR